MAALLIKDMPPELHERLRTRSREHRRSMSQEILEILEQALLDRAGPPTLEEIDQLRVKGAKALTQELLDEARQSGRP